MGLTYAEIELSNPREPERPAMRVAALADTGANMLCVPKHVALQLNLETTEHRRVKLADGRIASVPYIGPIQVRFEKRSCFVGAFLMGDEVVLGAVPMEDMDLVVSPQTREVTYNPQPNRHRV
ncbi:MAG TPA: clan AA aspartic protease [Candidatus Limnocylindrales bacterium]|nr:clan AA aspartic protease [Candidatus Limnocylindrales bacterium]